jgi:hypothetical protein
MERVYSFIFTSYEVSLTSDVIPSEIRRHSVLSGTQIRPLVHSQDSPPFTMNLSRIGNLSIAVDTSSCLCIFTCPVPALPHIPRHLVVELELAVSVSPYLLGSSMVPRVTHGT